MILSLNKTSFLIYIPFHHFSKYSLEKMPLGRQMSSSRQTLLEDKNYHRTQLLCLSNLQNLILQRSFECFDDNGHKVCIHVQ